MASLAQPDRKRRSRRFKLLILAFVILAIAGIAVAVIVSFTAPDRNAAFRRKCLAVRGNSVVVLSTKTHGVAMGAPQTIYKLGCRQASGQITSTYESNQP
jgi:hypothetical protein